MYKVERVDLASDDAKVIIELVDNESFENLCEYDAVGLIHINSYKEINQ